MPSLTIICGPNEGDYYPLGKRTMVIGRDEGCPVQIVDPKASRKHVQIRFDEAAFQHVALDMKSSNGTRLNGRDLTTETPLADNDEILIGSSRLVYSFREFPDKESALSHFKKRGQRTQPTIQQPH